MKVSYQETFSEVHASQRLKEEVMNMTKQERKQVVKRVSVSFIVAAALAVILAGTALAAVIGVPETLQDWFNQQWTEAGGGEEMPKEQSEIIDSLIQPVDVTAICNGVSVTLDSVTPGEGSICLMFKVKGENLKDGWEFSRCYITGGPMEKMAAQGGVGFSSTWKTVGVTEDGTYILLYTYDAPKGVNFLEGGEMELRIQDIMLGRKAPKEGEEPEDEYVEGKWILPFTLGPVTEQTVLTAKSGNVPCTKWEWGEGADDAVMTEETMDIQDIHVTSIGYSYLLPEKLLDYDYTKYGYDWEVPALQMTGGMTVGGIDSGRDGDDPKVKGSWDFPVDLSKVESIRFGDVVIPLEQPKK